MHLCGRKKRQRVSKIFDQLDLVLAGDGMILEAAGIESRKYLQETENQVFLRMFLRYLHKNHRRIYLLVESEEDGQELYDYLERAYGGIEIVGMAKVSAQNRADDMLVNAINGGEVDCVLSVLAPPLQEEFIIENRTLINAGLWMGLGADAPGQEQGIWKRQVQPVPCKNDLQKGN